MVVELRYGVSSSQGPRSYQEDLTIVVPDLRASLKSRPADEPSTTKHADDDASRGDVVDLSNLPSPSAYYGVSGVVTDRFPRAWHCAPGTGARSLLLFRPLRKNRVPHATTFFWLLPFASFVSSSYPNPVLSPPPLSRALRFSTGTAAFAPRPSRGTGFSTTSCHTNTFPRRPSRSCARLVSIRTRSSGRRAPPSPRSAPGRRRWPCSSWARR